MKLEHSFRLEHRSDHCSKDDVRFAFVIGNRKEEKELGESYSVSVQVVNERRLTSGMETIENKGESFGAGKGI